ncbi:helix-turn-helix domain-containing protein [Agrobacterium vitis]|uniref:helix-turn-helix domain-containing protein n=1 Tax=Agrobacterium vitis TaxID=373 RepID=UPI00403E98D8
MLDMNMPMKHIPHMKLDRYISEKDMTDAAFAALIGYSQPQVNRVRRGKSFPSPGMIRKIHEETNGAVSFADWYEPEQVGAA